jgi:hypothetical protein
LLRCVLSSRLFGAEKPSGQLTCRTRTPRVDSA